MNNKIKRILSFLFVLVLSFTFVAGCNNSSNEQPPVDTGVVYAKDANGNVISLVDDRKSDYKIMVADNAHSVELIASTELQKYVFESSKCKLPIVKESEITVDEQSKIISIGQTELFKQSSVYENANYAILGDDGTFVDVDGLKVYISGAKPVGTVYAVYEFLQQVMGWEAYATDEVYFHKTDSIKLVDFDKYVSVPAIQYRSPTYGEIKDPEKAKVLRLTGFSSLYGVDWGVQVHSIEGFCNESTHPQWFNNGQICLSNIEARDFIANALINSLASKPNSRFWELGHGDDSQACKCADCTATAQKYGGQGGIYVQWLNYIGQKVEEWQIANNVDREIWIVGLAYRGYADPPAVKNADGTYSPMDETVKCRDNVAIRYAPIEACYAHAINDPDCPYNGGGRFVENIKKWQACSPQKLWLWLYSCEYYDYSFMMNDFGQLMESYKLYDELNIYGIKDEMQPDNRAPFSALKLYLRSKLWWNPNQDIDKLMDDFFVNFYKEAAPYMREFFESIRAHFVKMSLPKEQGGFTNNGTSGCYINNSGHGMVYWNSEYWSIDLLKEYQKIIDKAYAALKEAGYSEEEYEKLRLRVRADDMFIAHYYVNNYSNYFSEEEYAQIKADYETDFVKLGKVVWGS